MATLTIQSADGRHITFNDVSGQGEAIAEIVATVIDRDPPRLMVNLDGGRECELVVADVLHIAIQL